MKRSFLLFLVTVLCLSLLSPVAVFALGDGFQGESTPASDNEKIQPADGRTFGGSSSGGETSITSTSDPAVAAEWAWKNFTDVKSGSWYADAVEYVLFKGIMNGISTTCFAPDESATRAMVVTMLWRLAGMPTNGRLCFSDVPDNAWYAQAVAWGAECGVINGVTANIFAPQALVTREQLATILYRYAKLLGKGFSGMWAFSLDNSDASRVSEYAYESLCWMTLNGIIKGMGDGTLNPNGNATRAQIAVIFMRFADVLEL